MGTFAEVWREFRTIDGFPIDPNPFWIYDVRTDELILNPEYISWVDTRDKASGSKSGRVGSALRQRHRLERDWQRINRFTSGYRGSKKQVLLMEFRVIGGENFIAWQADVGKIRFTLEELPNPKNDEQRYYCVAKYIVNPKVKKKIASTYGPTMHTAVYNLCRMNLWFLYKDAMAWVGLDFLYKKIHIRFPLTKTPYPQKYVRALGSPVDGYYVWHWLEQPSKPTKKPETDEKQIAKAPMYRTKTSGTSGSGIKRKDTDPFDFRTL